MSNSSNSQQNPRQTPFWHREKKDHLGPTIARIQRVNDPTTSADEVMKGAKILIIILLGFSGMLGALSYFKNFSISFDPYVAGFMALSLTFVIEWGKNKCATWATRIPFFQGWSSIWQTPANTLIFGGLVLVAVATFAMSIYNSTRGGEQLAQMLSHERNHVDFQPDTKGIDDQIAAIQGTITNAPTVKWKGKTYYQSEKSVRSANKSIESLQRQREQTVSMQRADYERNLALQTGQTNFASKLVLASGGWIELLQVLLIILRVACEHRLAGSSYLQQSPTPITGTQPTRSGAPQTAPIGFNLGDDGNVRTSNPGGVSVPQMSHTVPQPNAAVFLSVDEALLYFESKLKKEPSNFENKHANAATVANRISSTLQRVEVFLEFTPDGSIPAESGNRLGQYLEYDLYPKLEERRYEPNRRILQLIKQKTSQV